MKQKIKEVDVEEQLEDFDNKISVMDITEPSKESIDYLFSLKNSIILQPEFQRDFIWPQKKQKELIRSIWLGIPLPLFYFAKNGRKLEVIDGQQRLTTLFGFINPSSIKDAKVRSKLLKKISLRDNDNKIISINKIKRKVKDTNIHRVTVKGATLTSHGKYELFRVLNQGGMQLKPQEIRNCIFQRDAPKLNKFLKKGSRKLEKLTKVKYSRMGGEELVLRFLVIQMYNSLEGKVSNLLTKTDEIIKYYTTEVKLRKYTKKFNRFISNLKRIFPSNYFNVLKKDELQPDGSKWESHIFTVKPNHALFQLLAFYLPKYDSHAISRKETRKIRRGFIKLLKDKKFDELISGSGTDSPKKVNRAKDIFDKSFVRVYIGDYTDSKIRTISSEAKKTLFSCVPFCYLCYGKLNSLKNVHAEHISPHAKGSDSKFSNILLAHKTCNLKKSDLIIEDFRDTPWSIKKRKEHKKRISEYLDQLRLWNKDHKLDICRKLLSMAKKDLSL